MLDNYTKSIQDAEIAARYSFKEPFAAGSGVMVPGIMIIIGNRMPKEAYKKKSVIII